jgi:hypothetical protein
LSFTLCQPSAKRTAVTRLMSIARPIAKDLLSQRSPRPRSGRSHRVLAWRAEHGRSLSAGTIGPKLSCAPLHDSRAMLQRGE